MQQQQRWQTLKRLNFKLKRRLFNFFNFSMTNQHMLDSTDQLTKIDLKIKATI
jgi:hypothetical protein